MIVSLLLCYPDESENLIAVQCTINNQYHKYTRILLPFDSYFFKLDI